MTDTPNASRSRMDCIIVREATSGQVAEATGVGIDPRSIKLTSLRVSANSIGNGVVEALDSAANPTSLTEIDLSEERGYGRYNEAPAGSR